jgi:hypothetical protein
MGTYVKINLSKPPQKPSKSDHNRSKPSANDAKPYRFALAHLNIWGVHPLWRYQERGFWSSETPKKAFWGMQFDVSGFAKNGLTATAGTGNWELATGQKRCEKRNGGCKGGNPPSGLAGRLGNGESGTAPERSGFRVRQKFLAGVFSLSPRAKPRGLAVPASQRQRPRRDFSTRFARSK